MGLCDPLPVAVPTNYYRGSYGGAGLFVAGANTFDPANINK